MKSRLLVLFAVLSLAGPVMAQSSEETPAGIETLRNALAELDTLRADFEQTVLNSEFTVDEVSTGTFAIKRPGRFRWDYQEPEERLLLADGERMWIYEPEFEQATVQAMDATLATSPAMLLTGEADLEESFRIEDEGVQGALHWVRLTPRVQDSEFEQVRIGIGERTVELMELRDNLGGVTRIEFDNIELNPDLPDSLFQFEPPPGTDVIEQ